MYTMWTYILFIVTSITSLFKGYFTLNTSLDICNSNNKTENCSCLTGYYGSICDKACNCANNAYCSRENGTCLNGSCKQWFSTNPDVSPSNCNSYIKIPGQPNATLEMVDKTEAKINILMDKSLPNYLSGFYFYRITCIEQETGLEGDSQNISHSTSLDHIIITCKGLKMLTTYLTRIVMVRTQNGIFDEGKYLALMPPFTTDCNRPTAPNLHYQVWPEQIVYLYWKNEEIEAGCNRAIVVKLTLYLIGQTSEIRTWHSLLLDRNYTVLTNLKPGIYNLLIRVETDQSFDDSSIITVNIPQTPLILISIQTQRLWIITVSLLTVISVASVSFTIVLLVHMKRKSGRNRKNSNASLPIDDEGNCDTFEGSPVVECDDDVQRILPRENYSNMLCFNFKHKKCSKDYNQCCTLKLQELNINDKNVNNNELTSSYPNMDNKNIQETAEFELIMDSLVH